MMAPHLVEQEIKQDKVENIEKEINVRAVAWKRITNLGAG